MNGERERLHADLLGFLRTIQKPNRPIEDLGMHDSLVASGLLDSLATLHIVTYLETAYNIDFAALGVDPERLSSMAGILDLIEENRA